MSKAILFRKSLEEIRELYVAYEEAILVNVGEDEYQHPQITFTIIKEQGDNE